MIDIKQSLIKKIEIYNKTKWISYHSTMLYSEIQQKELKKDSQE